MTRIVLALAVTLAGALPTLAVMPPQQLQIVPVYSEPPAIKITWIERGDAPAGYDIERIVDAGEFAFLAHFPRGTVGRPIFFLDRDVNATSDYIYRVKACDAVTCEDSPPFTTAARVVWPIIGGHEVLHGFNEVIAWAGIGDSDTATGFHMGLDLNKTTDASVTTGNVVVAPRGGIICCPNVGKDEDGTLQADNGSIGIFVEVGDGRRELDSFNHLATVGSTVPPAAVGDVVAPGQQVGVIGTGFFVENFARHVHHMNERVAPIPPGQQWIIRHPLRTFTDPADKDPLGKPPELFDENVDGKLVLYREHKADGTGAVINYDVSPRPLYGDVDVEPEVLDEQGTNPRQAPIDLGYWIEGPYPDTEQLDDVKSAATPYRLYDFREEYFGGIAGGPPPAPCGAVADIDDVTNSGCRKAGPRATRCTNPPSTCGGVSPGTSCVSDAACGSGTKCLALSCAPSIIKEGTTNFPWAILHHFIVTHAKGEMGKRADVDANQFWRTAAKDDGAPVGSTHANYAGQPTTTKAWEARFPDGDYTIHVIASDLVHPNVDLKLPVVRLENFAPFVKEMIVARDNDENPLTGVPMLAGCESVIHHYRHTPRQPYGRAQDVLISRVASTIVPSGQQLCMLIRFSEPVMSVTVDLVRDRGTGALVPGAVPIGGLTKTYGTNDTWIGAVNLPIDQSGASDASPAGDEHDTAIRIVALDRRDATGTSRGLDVNSDGVPDAGGDLTHVVKLDLSLPTGSLDAEKP